MFIQFLLWTAGLGPSRWVSYPHYQQIRQISNKSARWTSWKNSSILDFLHGWHWTGQLAHSCCKKKTIENYSLSVMVKWPLSSLLSTDKITEDKFYFHFFEIPLDNIKILKQHSLGKTINRYYDKKIRLICVSFFSLDASLVLRCI